MVHSIPSTSSASSAAYRPVGDDGIDLSVEPVASRPGVAPRAISVSPGVRAERLRRLLLEVRVATLERELERARQRRAAVIEHYEHVLDDRVSDGQGPAFSWLGR